MTATAENQDASPAPAERGFASPSRRTTLIIAGALAMIVVLRILARTPDAPWPFHDPAHCNVATLIFAFIAAVATWIWFCFRSGLARGVQRVGVVAPLVLAAGFFGMFRLEEVDGNMFPRFEPRWQPRRDQTLGALAPAAEQATADLATTTPDDFPQFLGPERSCWLPERELARDWNATPPKLLWKQPIGAGWSGFAAVNGFAVTLEQRGAEEWTSCYAIETGKAVWGQAITARHENPLGGVGPRSTPTIHAGRVYSLGATGVLQCLDGTTGKPLWKEDLLERYGLSQSDFEAMVNWGRAGSPLIVDGLVVVPAGGPEKSPKALAAFDAESGSLTWEAEVPLPGGGKDQIAYASPVLATLAGRRQILIVNESTASGHDPATGEALWSHPWPGHSNMDASSSQPVPIAPDRVLLSKGYGGGAELLRLVADSDGGSLRVESLWKKPRVLETKFTNVVVHEGHVYGLSDSILECVDLDSGKRRWKKGRYGHGQILGVGDLLLVLAEDGRLALVEANPERYVELSQIQALEGKTWNSLCLYGKHLLIRNGQEAACYLLP